MTPTPPRRRPREEAVTTFMNMLGTREATEGRGSGRGPQTSSRNTISDESDFRGPSFSMRA
jgi:hypothetical protein